MPANTIDKRAPGWRLAGLGGLILWSATGCTAPQLSSIIAAGWMPEQQTIATRDPAALPAAPIPNVPPPTTVAADSPKREPLNLSLNEAVRIALENTRVVRVFTGIGAANSGRTIYDAAIVNTQIDQRQARFDPGFAASQTHSRTETPALESGALAPNGFNLSATGVDRDRSTVGFNKVNALGGRTDFGVVYDRTAFNRAVSTLDPEERKALELTYTQPLLLGGGFLFNVSPIVIARIDTERSYFQFKDATQEMVRGVIEAYWNLVLARLQVWATEIQYEQSDEAYKREVARQIVGMADVSNVAQAKVTINQFRASLIAARANVLDREAALRNVLGLPPADRKEIVPVSAPASLRYKADWESLLRFAEQRRPNIIELKLVLEADRQRRIQAENSALPQLDASATYRWNGLSGRLPFTGERVSADPSRFTDWTVGINFSVPLGLREGRARIREQDLIILRDQANLQQGLHAATHELAVTTRTLDRNYEQYLAYRETRTAALENLAVQIGQQRVGRGIYLSVLQALNDWGSAINSEAQALIDYNIQLANLEQQTGTILETHGLVFVEERFRAAGPLCLPGHERDYPKDLMPTGEPTRFPGTDQPGENAFDLKKPDLRPAKLKEPMPIEPKKELPAEPKFAEDKAK
jgi:outer membrane protein TolC